MENYGVEELIALNIRDKLIYVSNTIVLKYINNENTQKITALAVDYGKIYTPLVRSFATYIKVIEGEAEVVVNTSSTTITTTNLVRDDSMVILEDCRYRIIANQRYKMLSILLKNNSNTFTI
mgnify:CR=1 FL=1